MHSILRFVVLALLVCGTQACGSGHSSDRADETPAPQTPPATPPDSPPADNPPTDETGDPQPLFDLKLGHLSTNHSFIAKLDWIKGPVAQADSHATLTFVTSSGLAPSTVTDVVFNPQMPSMGHGTAMDDQVIRVDATKPYIFDVNGIYFIMGGSWVVHVTATVDGQRDVADFSAVVP